MDGGIWKCIDFQHRKPGKGNTVMNTKLKNVADGRVLERTFQVGFKLDDVRVEHRPYQYLYKDEMGLNFMHPETFEQISIPEAVIDGVQFLKEGDTVEAMVHAASETVLTCELPAHVDLRVTYTEPGLKGDTATNTLKPATVETGAEVRVPLFINEGELITIDTRDGSYVGRVKEA